VRGRQPFLAENDCHHLQTQGNSQPSTTTGVKEVIGIAACGFATCSAVAEQEKSQLRTLFRTALAKFPQELKSLDPSCDSSALDLEVANSEEQVSQRRI
jgi:hypothetical protein